MGVGGSAAGVAVGLFFLSGVGLASDMLAAVTAAPVAALMAAMIANVDFDILRGCWGGMVLDINERMGKSRRPESQIVR